MFLVTNENMGLCLYINIIFFMYKMVESSQVWSKPFVILIKWQPLFVKHIFLPLTLRLECRGVIDYKDQSTTMRTQVLQWAIYFNKL